MEGGTGRSNTRHTTEMKGRASCGLRNKLVLLHYTDGMGKVPKQKKKRVLPKQKEKSPGQKRVSRAEMRCRNLEAGSTNAAVREKSNVKGGD